MNYPGSPNCKSFSLYEKQHGKFKNSKGTVNALLLFLPLCGVETHNHIYIKFSACLSIFVLTTFTSSGLDILKDLYCELTHPGLEQSGMISLTVQKNRIKTYDKTLCITGSQGRKAGKNNNQPTNQKMNTYLRTYNVYKFKLVESKPPLLIVPEQAILKTADQDFIGVYEALMAMNPR